jgi:hypothetical protein
LAAAVPAVQEQELPAVAQVRLLVQAQSAAAVVVVDPATLVDPHLRLLPQLREVMEATEVQVQL